MSTAEEFKALGNKALQAKDFDGAVENYTKAIELDGSNEKLYSNRSAAYLSKGDAENALADGIKCVEIKPDWAKSWSRKGAAQHAMKQYDDAISTYNEGLAKIPGDKSLEDGLAVAQKDKDNAAAGAGMGGGANNPFGNIMGKLATHPKFGQWISDPSTMQKIQMMQSNPQSISMFLQDPTMQEIIQALLGVNLYQPGDGAEEAAPPSGAGASAAPPAPEPMETEPEPPRELSEEEQKAADIEAIRQQGNDHYKKKEWTEALACYQEVFEKDPEQVSVLNNKVAVYMGMKDWEAAEKQCVEAIDEARKLPGGAFELQAKIYVRWGNIYKNQKDLGKAIEYYEKAQMENSTKEVDRLIKNTVLEKKKADKLAYINPELAAEAKERGNEAFRSENWAQAIQEYEEAIKRDPKTAAYRLNLAATLCKVMDFQGASGAVEKALELDDKYVKAWARKGDIEFLRKEYHKAMESFKMGLKLEPENSACKQGLNKTVNAINMGSAGGEADKDRAAHGMADPEIQMILRDPIVNQVIRDLGGENPAAGQRAMQDPAMADKIQKLIAAGVLQTR